MSRENTICAISSPQGIGAIALIRITGEQSFLIVNQFINDDLNFLDLPARYAHLLKFEYQGFLIDQVVITKFVAPNSYTGEDMVEISCHGSSYVQQKIIQLLIDAGARLADPGEFTMRAFLHGKMDLSQAEAVNDLVESQSEITHKIAVKQLKGLFSDKIKILHTQLLNFASLLELELDFSEEDVAFADRLQLSDLLDQIKSEVQSLADSFKLGNVLKNGIPVAIIGKPNVGKSTLLNALVDDDRAIVSHLPGTTRDTIEDVYTIEGITFRFIDTAGIRSSNDEIENFGIERTYKAIEKADIILYIIDTTQTSPEDIETELLFLEDEIDLSDKELIIIANKIDQLNGIPHHFTRWEEYQVIYISAKRRVNLNYITDALSDYVKTRKLIDATLLTNARHYDILIQVLDAIDNIEEGFNTQLPTDLITIEVRRAMHNLSKVTGETATEDILENIFGRFCIGK